MSTGQVQADSTWNVVAIKLMIRYSPMENPSVFWKAGGSGALFSRLVRRADGMVEIFSQKELFLRHTEGPTAKESLPLAGRRLKPLNPMLLA